MADYELGPLPWNEDVLTKAYFRDFRQAQESIKQHPGYDLNERSFSLKAVLRMFDNAASSFFEALETFHVEAHERRLFDRVRRKDRRNLEEKFQEILYLFASSAMTLVDQSRALSKKVELPGYDERVAATFANNPRHRFIQELRNDLIHIKLHEPSWQFSTERDHTRITRFMLFPNELQRSGEWHKLAKEYLRQHSEGVDLGALISEYRAEIIEMQTWLQTTLSGVAGTTIGDYLRCNNFLLVVGDRCWWRLLLSQVVIQQGRDPYQYLDRYLTVAELDEVQRLPHKTKEQVDRIIDLIDEHGACDDEIRALTYKAFGIGMS